MQCFPAETLPNNLFPLISLFAVVGKWADLTKIQSLKLKWTLLLVVLPNLKTQGD